MTEIASASGLVREALYKALHPGSQPRFDTIRRVCGALGTQPIRSLIAAQRHPMSRQFWWTGNRALLRLSEGLALLALCLSLSCPRDR